MLFRSNFQEKLVHIMFRERLFCDQMREVIDLNFLENAYTRVFVEKIFEYKDKFQTHPSEQTVATILRSDLDGENEATQKQVREFFAKIVATKEVEDAEFVKSTALDFCKKQKLKEASSFQAFFSPLAPSMINKVSNKTTAVLMAASERMRARSDRRRNNPSRPNATDSLGMPLRFGSEPAMSFNPEPGCV